MAATVRPDPVSLHLPYGGADSHAHLDIEYPPEAVPGLLQHAVDAGLAHIGQVFLDPQAYTDARERFAAWPQVFFLLGMHPCDGVKCTEGALAAMRDHFSTDARLKAVGEIGLDFYWDDCPPMVQEHALRLQLALAKECDKPVVIHSRNAAPQTLAILEAEGFAGRPLLWHCFGGEDALPLLDRFLANGWHISIPGPVTYPANAPLREAVARIPLERLLVETDCPYLTPTPWRGKPNEPALVVFTAQTVAACVQLPVAELWLLCGANARRFFGLEPFHVPSGSPPPHNKSL